MRQGGFLVDSKCLSQPCLLLPIHIFPSCVWEGSDFCARFLSVLYWLLDCIRLNLELEF